MSKKKHTRVGGEGLRASSKDQNGGKKAIREKIHTFLKKKGEIKMAKQRRTSQRTKGGQGRRREYWYSIKTLGEKMVGEPRTGTPTKSRWPKRESPIERTERTRGYARDITDGVIKGLKKE